MDRKNSIKTDLKKLTPTTLKVLIGGDAVMEAEKFLSHCNFLDTMDEERIQCFKDCIKEMTHMERSRLCKFVTGSEFLRSNQPRITIEPSSRTNFSLPIFNMCKYLINTIISKQKYDERQTNCMLIFQQILWFEMNSIPLLP